MPGFGWKPDIEDQRDKPFSLARPFAGVVPPEASLRPFIPEVLDQLNTNTCVANAVAQAVRTALLYRGIAESLISREFIYYNSRAWHGDEHSDLGTYTRTCIKGLVRFGAPIEEDWPFDVSRVNEQPPWNAYRLGYDFRGVHGYLKIFDDEPVLDAVRESIASGHPVVSGWDVDASILPMSGASVLDVPTGNIIGGHAMMICSYTSDGLFELCNSWGPGYRDNGFVRCTPAFVLAGQDRWVVDVA